MDAGLTEQLDGFDGFGVGLEMVGVSRHVTPHGEHNRILTTLRIYIYRACHNIHTLFSES